MITRQKLEEMAILVYGIYWANLSDSARMECAKLLVEQVKVEAQKDLTEVIRNKRFI